MIERQIFVLLVTLTAVAFEPCLGWLPRFFGLQASTQFFQLSLSSARERERTVLGTSKSDDDGDPSTKSPQPLEGKEIKPDILKPFLPAVDPNYTVEGPVGHDGFVLLRTGGPLPEELANENILKIVKIECSDLEVNTLVWKCLGYRFDTDEKVWRADEVFPKWKEKYPTPPDLIGMQRIYSKDVDQPSLKSNQSLVRSIPANNKQSLKAQLKPLGWKGYQFAELTPNKTRRAQCANWLVYFREELYGKTLEQLIDEKRSRKEVEAAEAAQREAEGKEKEWKPPVTEVF